MDRCLDQPPPCHVDAVCTDLHFQGVLPCPLPAPRLYLGAGPLTVHPSLPQKNEPVSSTSRPPVAPTA